MQSFHAFAALGLYDHEAGDVGVVAIN